MTGGSESWLDWVFKIVNFGILVGVLVKFAGKPFKEYFVNRHNTIKERLEKAEKVLKEAQEMKATYEEKLGHLNEEIEQFKKAVLDDAAKESKRIQDEALAFASKLREQAALTYGQEAREIRDRIREDVVRLTMEQAEKLVKERLTKDDNDRIVEEFIEKIGSLN